MLRGGSRIARNGLAASIGWRRSGGRISRTIVGGGESGLADGPCEDVSRRIHVRTSLTLATKVSLGLDDAICRVFQRMLLSSSNVSVNTTVQGPSVFPLNCHPRRSRPESDEGRCRVEAISGIVGATVVLCGSAAKKFLSSCRPSSSWVLDAGSCTLLSAMSCILAVRLRSWSKLLAPGATSGAGKSIMLSEMQMDIVSWIKQQYDR